MKSKLCTGAMVPNFQFKSTKNIADELANYRDKTLVIYFYPKDNTPGCNCEAKNFRDLYPQFQQEGAEILGISRDKLSTHEKFAAKHAIPFPLISDEDETICNLFDVLRTKLIFGKSIFGLMRSTFVLDKTGKLIKEWRKVHIKGHAQEVLSLVKSLNK